MAYAATAAQTSFINKLIAGKFASITEAAAEFGIPSVGSINKNEASAMIDWLKSLDRTPEQNERRAATTARLDDAQTMIAKLIAKEITNEEFSAWQKSAGNLC